MQHLDALRVLVSSERDVCCQYIVSGDKFNPSSSSTTYRVGHERAGVSLFRAVIKWHAIRLGNLLEIGRDKCGIGRGHSKPLHNLNII